MKNIKSKYFLWLAAIVFSAAVVLPLLFLIFSSLFTDGKFTTENFTGIFQASVLKSILNSVIIAASVSVLSVTIGCGFAFLIAKTNLPFKNILMLLLLLPLLLPPYISTVAWTDVWLYIGIPENFINSLPAVIFILITIYIPLAAFIISGSLQNITASIEEAGEMLMDYKTVFLKIILPLIRPALFSSFILIFILSVSEFAVPSYLSINVFTTEIFTQFTAFYNYSSAIAHSLVLTAICLLFVIPEKYYLAKGTFISFGKKSFSHKIISLRHSEKWLLFCVVYILCFVLLPILMLVWQTVSGNKISFMGIIHLLLPALKDSLLLSTAGALLITLFGFAFATISVKHKIKTSDYLLLIVFAVPAIATGIALTKFYNTPSLNFIYGSSLIVLIAFTARFLFISQNIIANSLMQIPSSFEEAALMLGASPLYTFRKIIFPLLAEALFTSFFFMLIFCIGELTTVIMVYPPGISLLPVRIFTLMANAPQSTVSGMCLMALLFSLLLIAIMLGGKKVLFNQRWKTRN
ncbi:MAG: iron ABC transporter permease [Bacteroidia bacterium]